MNWEIFSTAGYVSVALWLCVPVVWLLHRLWRPRRWLCHVAVVVAVAALVLAKINSATYVSRIHVDRSKEIAEQMARQEAAREEAKQKAKEERLGNTADIAFAEDDAGDAMDEAGMTAADRKYLASFDEDETPEWKKPGKQERTAGTDDDSLEALIGAVENAEGIDADVLIEEAPPEPILMSDKDKAMADRLDSANLRIAKILLGLACIAVVVDYFSRGNVYEEAYLPLPLPSKWFAAFTSPAAVSKRPESPRRSLLDELLVFAKRGEPFIYITDDESSAAKVPERAFRLPFGKRPVDILRVDGELGPIDDDFVFETLWFGLSSFVCSSPERAEKMLARFMELLTERRAVRARARQTVRIVWDIAAPISEDTLHRFAVLGNATGYTLLLCRES